VDINKVVESTQKKGVGRDPRLAGLKQTKFNMSATEVKTMFGDIEIRTNPMLKRSGNLAGGSGLAGPTGLSSGKSDPLKLQFESIESGGQKPSKKPQTYKEHVDKVSKLYDSYLNLDQSGFNDKKRKKPLL